MNKRPEPKVKLAPLTGDAARRRRQKECGESQQGHDFQPKFNAMSETFSFFRCDKCGEIR